MHMVVISRWLLAACLGLLVTPATAQFSNSAKWGSGGFSALPAGAAQSCAFGTLINGLCQGAITSGTTWTVPSDFTAYNDWGTIAGGGGAGWGTSGSAYDAAGGGGAYSVKHNVSLTPGATAGIHIGAGGAGASSAGSGTTGGDTWACTSTANCATITGSAVFVGAKGGGGGVPGNPGTPGTGGAAASGVGDGVTSGGNGGVATYAGGGAGGGAGGPYGPGADGGHKDPSAIPSGGGGGGGGGGGFVGGSGVGTTAGIGGNNFNGLGGAAGGTVGSPTGSVGSGGGGGGGGYGSNGVSAGGAGGNGSEFDATHGSGGGGGGSGFSNTTIGVQTGGNGGLYGGGGGAAFVAGPVEGNGAQGMIWIAYVPSWGSPVVGPGDIYATAGTPPVAVYSVTRRMYAAYPGLLLQLQRASDGSFLSVGPNAAGVVDLSAVAAFCATANDCGYSKAMDQGGVNVLMQPTLISQMPYRISPLNGLPILFGDTLNTSVGICDPLNGPCTFLNNVVSTNKIPVGASPITLYEIRTNENSATCGGEFGDTEIPVGDHGSGHLFGLGYTSTSATSCPNFPLKLTLELENGDQGASPATNPSVFSQFGRWDGTTNITLKYGDATAGTLTTILNQAPPQTPSLEGGVAWSSMGDATSGHSAGFEAMIMAGSSANATDDAAQVNAAAFYGARKATYTCGTAYCGPGNVIASASAAYGLRAYSLATRGNNLINVCDPSNIACADIASDATTGRITGFPTLNGTNCGSVTTCTVKTAYELSGSGAPNVTQTTAANRPTLNPTCSVAAGAWGGGPCLVFGSGITLNASSAVPSMSLPLTISSVVQRTGATNTEQTIALIGSAQTGTLVNSCLGYTSNAGRAFVGTCGVARNMFAGQAGFFTSLIATAASSSITASHMNGGSMPIPGGLTGPNTASISLGRPVSPDATADFSFFGVWTETQFYPGAATDAQALSLGLNQAQAYGY